MTARLVGSGPVAAAIADALDQEGGDEARVVLIVPSPIDAAATIAAMRDAAPDGGGSILLVMPAEAGTIDRQMLVAGIAPLAVELAPKVRISVIDPTPDATVRDIVAAAAFLIGASSTTGQVLRVG